MMPPPITTASAVSRLKFCGVYILRMERSFAAIDASCLFGCGNPDYRAAAVCMGHGAWGLEKKT
jgi:hypothetical protein